MLETFAFDSDGASIGSARLGVPVQSHIWVRPDDGYPFCQENSGSVFSDQCCFLVMWTS